MKNIIMAAVSTAVESLYHLDIKLSKHFVGKPGHPNDVAVAAVRNVIRHALDTLHTENWLPQAEGIDKGPDWVQPVAKQLELGVLVTLQVDMDEPHTETEISKAAVQAIANAVRLGEDNGFSHDLADDVSFGLVAVDSRPPMRSGR
jgi:hypothetical protein